jgi:hypothetical protein
MRKLLKGVLHTAAPNELVLPWARQNNKECDRVGRPTRATKVEWLCQFIPNEAYRSYVRTELNSALALIDLLDAAQHVDEFPEFEQQYDWTILRVEVAIRTSYRLEESQPIDEYSFRTIGGCTTIQAHSAQIDRRSRLPRHWRARPSAAILRSAESPRDRYGQMHRLVRHQVSQNGSAQMRRERKIPSRRAAPSCADPHVIRPLHPAEP